MLYTLFKLFLLSLKFIHYVYKCLKIISDTQHITKRPLYSGLFILVFYYLYCFTVLILIIQIYLFDADKQLVCIFCKCLIALLTRVKAK